jgi:starvation-inducible DNA-binding protein
MKVSLAARIRRSAESNRQAMLVNKTSDPSPYSGSDVRLRWSLNAKRSFALPAEVFVASHSESGRRPHKLEAQPLLGQRAKEIQPYGTLARYPLGLSDSARTASVEALNQVLCDTMCLRDMYKKHHWQVSGPTFYSLHLLFDKHYEEQATLVDTLAERVQSLGGVAIAMAHDVAEMTKLERPPRGREEAPVQISRLLEAHEVILSEAHKAAKAAADNGDDGTNDVLVSDIIRPMRCRFGFSRSTWWIRRSFAPTAPAERTTSFPSSHYRAVLWAVCTDTGREGGKN